MYAAPCCAFSPTSVRSTFRWTKRWPLNAGKNTELVLRLPTCSQARATEPWLAQLRHPVAQQGVLQEAVSQIYLSQTYALHNDEASRPRCLHLLGLGAHEEDGSARPCSSARMLGQRRAGEQHLGAVRPPVLQQHRPILPVAM